LETARALLRQGTPLQWLKEFNMTHYLSLEGMLSQASTGGTLEAPADRVATRRAELASVIMGSLAAVKPGRLLSFLQSAILWEQQAGRIAKEARTIDLMTLDTSATQEDTNIAVACNRFPKQNFASRVFPCEAAAFSQDGSFVAIGTASGEIQAWDHRIGAPFPAKARTWTLLSVSGGVTFLSFSRDGKRLLVGTTGPEAVVFDASTGDCLFKLPNAHNDAVSCVDLSIGSNFVLTSGLDEAVRLWGTRSKGVLGEFRDHSGFIESVFWVVEPDDSQGGVFASAGSDGFLRLWDIDLKACIFSLSPPSANELAPPPLKQILGLDELHLLVVSSECLHIFSRREERFVRRIALPGSVKGAVISAAVRANFIVLMTDSGKFVVFGRDEPHSVLDIIDAGSPEPINFALHPVSGWAVSFDIEGSLKFWK
jgi:hypothetical protein